MREKLSKSIEKKSKKCLKNVFNPESQELLKHSDEDEGEMDGSIDIDQQIAGH